MEDVNFHFEDDAVMGAISGTDYLVGNVNRALHTMNSGEKWSLYRAIANLAYPVLIADLSTAQASLRAEHELMESKEQERKEWQETAEKAVAEVVELRKQLERMEPRP